MANAIQEKNIKNMYPLISAKERLLIWQKARGMWKNRKPDPIIEAKKISKELDRKLNRCGK